MTIHTDQERRKFKRVNFNAEVVMQCGHEEWTANLIDISLKGMLVEPPSGLEADTSNPFAIALFLGEDVSIHARVTIVHTHNGHWGLEWQHIDFEGITHLRRLLELNMEDPEALNRELAQLA